jgi:hypothetical protein
MALGFSVPAMSQVARVTPVSGDHPFVQYVERFSPGSSLRCGSGNTFGTCIDGSFNPRTMVLTSVCSQPGFDYGEVCPQQKREVVLTSQTSGGRPMDYVFRDPDGNSDFGASVAVLADGSRTSTTARPEEIMAVGDGRCGPVVRGSIVVYDVTRKTMQGSPPMQDCVPHWDAPRTIAALPSTVPDDTALGFGGSVRLARLPGSSAGVGEAVLGAAHGGIHGSPPGSPPSAYAHWSHVSVFRIAPSSLGRPSGVRYTQTIDLRKQEGLPEGWERRGTDFAMQGDLLVVSSVILEQPCLGKEPIREVLVFRATGNTQAYRLVQRMSSDDGRFAHLARTQQAPFDCDQLDAASADRYADPSIVARCPVSIDGDRIIVGMPWERSKASVATFVRASSSAPWMPELIVQAPEGTSDFGGLVAGGRGRYLALSVSSSHRNPALDLPCLFRSGALNPGGTPAFDPRHVECADGCDRFRDDRETCTAGDVLVIDIPRAIADAAASGLTDCEAVRRSGGVEGTTWTDLSFAGPVLLASAADAILFGCGAPCQFPDQSQNGLPLGAIVMHGLRQGLPGAPDWPFIGSSEFVVPDCAQSGN